MQARTLMVALPVVGIVRSTMSLPSEEDLRSRLRRMNHRSVMLCARVAEARAAHTHRFDVVGRGRGW